MARAMRETMYCPSCAGAARPEWHFCRLCGEPLEEPAPAAKPEAPAPPRRKARQPRAVPDDERVPTELYSDGPAGDVLDLRENAGREQLEDQGGAEADGPARRFATDRRALTRRAAVAALVAVALIASGVWAVRTRSNFAETRQELRGTELTLASTEDALADTRADLQRTTDDRDQLRSRLAGTEAELGRVRGELQGVQTTLSDTRNELNLQAGQIELLKTCLVGVSNALLYAADFDYSGALASLESVSVACESARELF